jgi:UPF0716 family protein affecting phage T7 exclusion
MLIIPGFLDTLITILVSIIHLEKILLQLLTPNVRFFKYAEKTRFWRKKHQKGIKNDLPLVEGGNQQKINSIIANFSSQLLNF